MTQTQRAKLFSLGALILQALFLPATLKADESAPWYEIELVIFARTDGPQATSESWSSFNTQPNIKRQVLHQNSAEANFGLATEQPYYLLPSQQNSLGPIAYSLRQRGGYRILKTISWRQPAVSRKQAVPVVIYGGQHIESRSLPLKGDGNVTTIRTSINQTTELEGLVRLAQDKYIHLQLDLSFMLANGQFVRLNQSRKVQTQRLEYYDHPMIGVIAKIIPYEKP